MLASYFYHSTMRNYVIMFGRMFTDMTIFRQDLDKDKVQQVKVPITYGPAQKYLARTEQNVTTVKPVGLQLPRMSFQMTGMSYDAQRSISPIHKRSAVLAQDVNKRRHQFVPLAYDFRFQLSILIKNIDDGLQIVEQIVPFFRNKLSNSVNLIPELGITMDIDTVMEAINMEDSYEGPYVEDRVIVWTIDFLVKGWVFGPTETMGIIKRAQVDFLIPPGAGPITDEEVASTPRSVRYSVTPGLTADGQPTTDPDTAIPWSQVVSTDDYAFLESIEYYADSKKYDPKTGEDK